MAPLDPSLSDQQIKNTFNSLERRFYQWGVEQNNLEIISEREDQAGRHLLSQEIEAAFRDIQNPIEEFVKFSDKWFGRAQRRMQAPVRRAELLNRIKATKCNDNQSIGQTIGMLNMRNCEDIIVGESQFGGRMMGYALTVNAQLLYPDVPHAHTSNLDSPQLLDRAVLAIDMDVNSTSHSQRASDSLSSRRRGQGSSSGGGSSSGQDSTISIRSANSDDFLGRQPFCFLQIGHLICCTGDEWRTFGSDPEVEWKPTGYSLVVQLGPQGYADGAVYAIFDFHLPVYENAPGNVTLWKEIEWKDSTQTELPHIRRLYTDCNKQFFLAKVANRLEDLGPRSRFTFEVVRERRVSVVRAKAGGAWGPKVIPNDIVGNVEKVDWE